MPLWDKHPLKGLKMTLYPVRVKPERSLMPKDRRVSEEEKQFAAWLMDAENHGLVKSWEEQPETFELIPKSEIAVGKKKPKFLFHPHRYTADFRVHLTEPGQELLREAFAPAWVSPEWKQLGILWVDTKGSFTVQHGQDQIFQANRKLLWHYNKIWIAKVIPWASQCDRQGNPKAKPKKCLFVETFCPQSMRTPKSGWGLTAMGKACQTVEQFIKA